MACANRGTVVLLPEEGAGESAVTIKQDDQAIVLDRPYAGANLTRQGPVGYQSSPQDVQAKFGAALAAQPSRAESFVLYFVEGKDELTDDSKRLADQILAAIARRAVPDVLVVGHSDTVGSDQVNDALSLRRAEAIRTMLIERGVPADDVRAFARGKRELAVPTPDGVAEPRNRRVEIVVR